MYQIPSLVFFGAKNSLFNYKIRAIYIINPQVCVCVCVLTRISPEPLDL